MSKTGRLVDDLAQHLRTRILAGEFPADAKVTESGLAAEYGVARPTVRSAVELLVSDGLLCRSPFAALRVPSLPLTELPELLRILDFTEMESMTRIRATSPDLRDLRRAASGSLHNFLDAIVRASGSPRLEWIHRRCTFELILLLVQHTDPAPAGDAEHQRTMRQLADAVVTDRYEEATALLADLHTARRTHADALAVAS